MTFDPTRPYNDLPSLPPRAEIDSKAILNAGFVAGNALGQLKSASRRLPDLTNQNVLINTIPMLEARGSSEIENIITTSDELFRFAQLEAQATDPAVKEALRYRSALREGMELIGRRPLNANTAEKICGHITGKDMQIRRLPGTSLKNSATGEVIYTPPDGETRLRDKLDNWANFIHNQTEINPLIRMAVAHYQFEAIHPFEDGNGRTGRILNLLLLVHFGLLELPVLYLSRYILRHRAEYYRGLHAVTRDGAWESWIVYMIKAVAETAVWTTKKINSINELQNNANNFVKAKLPKIYKYEFVEQFFLQPYCRIQNLVDAGIAKRQTASVYLQQLVELGMLRETQVGRQKLFVHENFLHLLTSDDHEVLPYDKGLT